jgi:hypothetical protein
MQPTTNLRLSAPRSPVPEVSRFYGISVRFYYRDHPPTHFHAFYAEHEALIEIDSGSIHRGYLPPIALNLVNSWRLMHLEELRQDWERARQQLPLLPIAPLE